MCKPKKYKARRRHLSIREIQAQIARCYVYPSTPD